VRTIVSSIVWSIVFGPLRSADVPHCPRAHLYIDMTTQPTLSTSRPENAEARALLVNIMQAAEMLSISRSSIYHLMATDQLTPIRIGRSVRFPVEQLERFVETRIAETVDRTESQVHPPLG
jgi:excisionase family DNA binding protein